MSKKFSIVTTIDVGKIDEEITKYVNLNGNFDPYIFMNEDTASVITNEVGVDIVIDSNDLPHKRNAKNGISASYAGYKVFINNDLTFGIVEIR